MRSIFFPISKVSFFSFFVFFLHPHPKAAQAGFVAVEEALQGQAVVITGELKKWHPVTFSIDGPTVDQQDTINPFSDYRLQITFTKDAETLSVPGYFAADGNAAETSATSGNIWRAHFTPPETGTWNYVISFVRGTDVAIDELAVIDEVIIDNEAGSIVIGDTDKTGRDFRGKGSLRYVDEAYLQFDNGEWYLKSGIDSPENILAYSGFDSTYTADGNDFVKDFTPHVQDWVSGDPSWQNGKGKGIIGAVNYLSSQGINSAFILLNNIGQENDNDAEGNDDVWPFITPSIYDRYDVSKLEQWNIFFSHMQKKGIMLHFALQEIDNDALLDNGDLGRNRKLFYREFMARFGYHNALTWNIGEELRSDRNTDAQRKSYIDYISSIDPYGHAVIGHTWPGDDEYEAIYGPLLGYDTFDGASFQIHDGSDGTGDLKVYDTTKNWYNQAKDSGRKWYMTIDECCGWQTGVRPSGTEYNLDDVRVDDLWGNLMAGGSGAEWFFGDRKPIQLDLSTEDFRPYQLMWDYTRYALDFFHSHLPFHEMEPQTDLSESDDHLVFAKKGEIYAVYLREGQTPDLNLEANVGNYRVKWFNPRVGGGLRNGTVKTFSGAGLKNLGLPPEAPEEDWVALVENVGFSNYALADFSVTQSLSNPRSYTFDAGVSQSFGGSISSYDWDFGDGAMGSGVSATHTYTHSGTYHVTLSVTDSQGNTDISSQQTVVFPVFSTAVNGLMGEYYDNLTFSETPETRLDPRINFVWGNKIPISKVAKDSFTVRWSGHIMPDHTDSYNFRMEADDGARLWIDDVLLIDNWDNTGFIDASVSVALQAHFFHKIQIEYRENEGTAHTRLFWSSSTLAEQLIPESHFFYDASETLPVELTAFHAVTDNNQVLLSWETASEANNAGFEVERSNDGASTYERIGFVRGNGTTTEASAYQFADKTSLKHVSDVSYRLKQLDFDGSFAYSKTISVALPAPNEVSLHKNFPNPFNPTTVIQYEMPQQGHVNLVVFDATGRQIAVLVDQEVNAGRYQAHFDASHLASGVYFYRLETARKSITHSMLLTK